jgi:hypothetical protein
MRISSLLERMFQWLFVIGLLLVAATLWQKDRLPDPDDLDLLRLDPPRQTATDRAPFTTRVRDQTYRIEPKADYVLDGIVVSSSDADAIKNIWHHKSWKDFINLRDLCVIWGENAASGVFREMRFRNDSWTCWASWSDPSVGSRFRTDALANNHLLTEDPALKAVLMSAEPGDHIRLRGVLAEYTNLGNGYSRGTSLRRDDTGNGACETIYLDDFQILDKANRRARRLYSFGFWLAVISAIGVLVMLPIAPYRVRAVR